MTTPTGTIAVNETDLHYGEKVTFSVTATDAYKTYVRVKVLQNGAVISLWSSVFSALPSYTTRAMGLYSPNWSGGAAQGVAELYEYQRNGRTNVLATVTFEVAA